MRYALAAVILAIATQPASAVETRVGGILGNWLVADVIRDDTYARGLFLSDGLVTAAKQCGIDVEPYSSDHFSDMMPGFTIVGAAPYASDAAAAANLKSIRRCVPTARIQRLMFFK